MPPGDPRSSAPTGVVGCRKCGKPLQHEPLTCPACDAPRPTWPAYHGEGINWQTAATWRGYPLVHIAFGQDAEGKIRTARGVIAIGQRAVGIVAIGILATGVISIGVAAAGLCSAGVVAVAAVAACGVNAVAPVAIGVSAVGYAVAGVGPVGWRRLF